MKKFIVFLSVYLLFLAIPINSNLQADSGIVKYQLYMDSERDDILSVKEEITTILEYLCDGVDENSYTTIVNANLSMFKKIEDSHVKWKNATLIVKIGDGKGSFIQGNYEKNEVCLKEVQPKSKIMEWLGIN